MPWLAIWLGACSKSAFWHEHEPKTGWPASHADPSPSLAALGPSSVPTPRAPRPPPSPSANRALDQLEDDPGRVDLAEQWRPYSRLHYQQPEGPPLTKMQKLRDSLAAHLPAAEQPAAVAAFLDRVQAQIQARWHVALPPPAPFVPQPAPIVPLPQPAPAPAAGLQMPAGEQQAAAAMGAPPFVGLPGVLAASAAALAPALKEEDEEQQQTGPEGALHALADSGAAPPAGDNFSAPLHP